MSSDFETKDQYTEALSKLAGLRRFSGPPALFWQSYLDALLAITGARYGLVARRREGDSPGWRKVVAAPANAAPEPLKNFFGVVEVLCDAALTQESAMHPLSAAAPGEVALAVRLDTGRPSERWAAVFLLEGVDPKAAGEVLKRLRLANALPADVQHFQASNRAPGAAAKAASVLDLLVLLDAQRTFIGTAIAFVNELSGRHQAERVSLGWEKNGYIKLKAISHTDTFVGKMEIVRQLEAAMEEAFDQDDEIYWPPLDGETLITRDHGAFAEAHGVKHLCSVPLRLAGEPVGIVTLERNAEAFVDDEIRLLRLACDLATTRLADLHKRDRWFGARWALAARENFGKWLGPEHTWAKALAIGGAVLLAVLLFGRITYRVEAPFILRTDNMAYLSAPFAGFIGDVDAEVGETFKIGDRLLTLDTRDLLLEQAAAAADLSRYQREEEKARAANELAEMRISHAQADQARVRLELAKLHLSQAEIRSPFDAYVIEGDLKKRLGAPVKQGDVLFKVARLDRLYIEAKVNERDIQEVAMGAPVEIAFASAPKNKFPAKVRLIEPVATAVEKENVFLVRCELATKPADWWRPGMAGISKVSVGKRTFAWIIFHRTVDFLRLLFWW